MDRTRIKAGASTALFTCGEIALQLSGYTSSLLAAVFAAGAVASAVILVKPEWWPIRRRHREDQPITEGGAESARKARRIGMDIEGGTTRLRRPKIRNQDTSIRTKDADFDADDLDVK